MCQLNECEVAIISENVLASGLSMGLGGRGGKQLLATPTLCTSDFYDLSPPGCSNEGSTSLLVSRKFFTDTYLLGDLLAIFPSSRQLWVMFSQKNRG